MAVRQGDIGRTLRPFTVHAHHLMSQARADVERVPAVLTLVQRALDRAGLKETVGMALHLDTESAVQGAKAFPVVAPCPPSPRHALSPYRWRPGRRGRRTPRPAFWRQAPTLLRRPVP
jgi:hypothetical protein